MSNRRHHLFLSLTALLAAGTSAGAADLYPIQRGFIQSAPELTPVEVGNGWYIRGDISYDLETDFDGSHAAYSPFEAVTDDYDSLTLRDGFGGGGGIGYQFTDFLRADVTARYSRADLEGFTDFSPTCIYGSLCDLSEESEAETWELMANAYVDLGTFAGFTPYIGAGAGAVRVAYEDVSVEYCDSELLAPGVSGCTSTAFQGEESWRFAYSLSAGLAYNISRALSLDIGYRYLNVEGGDLYDVELDGLDLPGWGVAGEDDGFDRHTIQAGLRYKLW